MIRAPVSVVYDGDEIEPASKSNFKPRTKHHQSSNSLGQTDFEHDSEEPNTVSEDVNAEHADDEIDEPLDYEEQKRRRSFERKVHRQTQRRGSINDYEQSDDVQFVQRIQSYNSLTGKEIARLQGVSHVSIKPKRQVPPAVPGKEKSQQISRFLSNSAPGHHRKTTLDLWKEKAAEMKSAPAFPPHQIAISSSPVPPHAKCKKNPTFQRLAEESDDADEIQEDLPSFPTRHVQATSGRHERSPTLQGWKLRADQAELQQPVASAETTSDDFGTIEDQFWATNVKGGDTLKRFKQHQPRSIASNDLFASPEPAIDEFVVEESEDACSHAADSQSDASSYQASDDSSPKDSLMRELIRDCLRVIGSMSRSGLINQSQKIALKGLTFRKDKRIVEIAKRFRRAKSNATINSRDLIMHDMELALARLACNID